MRVILNSDILFHTYLVRDRLSSDLDTLFKACADGKHTVVIPSTTLLEFERKQAEHVERERHELAKAYSMLAKFGVDHQEPDPTHLVRLPDAVELIRNYGVEVSVEEPTLADFKDAHNRACLQDSPHPRGKDSDEMRDLIIWAIACRIALSDGGALLLSRDIVHVGTLGDEEAMKAKLVRLKSVVEALEFFQARTPAGAIIIDLVAPVWKDLASTGLPIGPTPSITGISKVAFIQGLLGPELIRFRMTAAAHERQTLSVEVELSLGGDIVRQVALTKISVDGKPWKQDSLALQVEKRVAVKQVDLQERMKALKVLLGASR